MSHTGEFTYGGRRVVYRVSALAPAFGLPSEVRVKRQVKIEFVADPVASLPQYYRDELVGPDDKLVDPDKIPDAGKLRELYILYVIEHPKDGEIQHTKEPIPPAQLWPGAAPAGDPQAGSRDHDLKLGSRDVPGNPPLVRELQHLLNEWGGLGGTLLETGVFDGATEQAVKSFQTGKPLPAHNPTQKGYVDKATWDALRHLAQFRGRRATRVPTGRSAAQAGADSLGRQLSWALAGGQGFYDRFSYVPPVTFPRRGSLTYEPIDDMAPIGMPGGGVSSYDTSDVLDFDNTLFSPFSFSSQNRILYVQLSDSALAALGLDQPSADLTDKVSRVLALTFSNELGAELWEAVVSEEFLTGLAEGLFLYLVGMAFGVSEVLTVAFTAYMYYLMAEAALQVLEQLGDIVTLILDADSLADPQLEEAAKKLRAVVTLIITQAIVMGLLHAAVKSIPGPGARGRGRSPGATRRAPGPAGWRPSTQPGVLFELTPRGTPPEIGFTQSWAKTGSIWGKLEMPEGWTPERPSRPTPEARPGGGREPPVEPGKSATAKSEGARAASESPKEPSPAEKPLTPAEKLEQLERDLADKTKERQEVAAKEKELRQAGEAREAAQRRGDEAARNKAAADIERLKNELKDKPSSDGLLREEQKLKDEVNRLRDPQQVGDHLKRLQEYKAEAEKELAEAEKRGDKNAASAAKKRITEAKGEIAATEHMAENHPNYVLKRGFRPGGGYDQVWEGPNGDLMIVEAKGPGAGLDTTAQKGPQMSRAWVEATAKEMANSPTADEPTKALGRKILDGLRTGKPRVRGLAVEAVDGVKGGKQVPVPDGGVYDPLN